MYIQLTKYFRGRKKHFLGFYSILTEHDIRRIQRLAIDGMHRTASSSALVFSVSKKSLSAQTVGRRVNPCRPHRCFSSKVAATQYHA